MSIAHFLIGLLLAIANLSGVDGFWRMLCPGHLGVVRVDPIVAYGMISEHAHAVHGASNFKFTTTADDLVQSNCTSCAIKQDRSVYWTPAMYFKDDNGSFTLVPRVGSMTIYYFNDNQLFAGEKLTAFPRGFKMISGDTRRRNMTLPIPDPPMSEWTGDDSTQFGLAQKSTGFNCLNYEVIPAEGTLVYHYMRNKAFLDENCPQGVRLEIMFPSCWDGKNLDSTSHKDHILFPAQRKTGECPDGFKVRTPVLLFETIMDTALFKNLSGTFVFANGDPTGFGYHGDFISGWDPEILQDAVDNCNDGSGLQERCHVFDLQSEEDSRACEMTVPDELKNEDVFGPMQDLPGGVLIQSGPDYARKPSGTPLVPSGSESAATSSQMSSPPSVVISSVDSDSTSSSSASASPLTTPAANAETPAGSPAYTTSYTTSQEVVDVIYVEETVTVFITIATTVSPGAAAKRHLHRHQHGGHLAGL